MSLNHPQTIIPRHTLVHGKTDLPESGLCVQNLEPLN